jgi:hypothetical protein
MREASSKLRGLVAMAAMVAALLLAVGCGGSGDHEVTVQTGSLSKAEFIKKADAICKAVRTEFTSDYLKFLRVHKAKKFETQSTDAFLTEVVDSVIQPHFESEIQRIGALGAPEDYATEVESYLDALKGELEVGQEDPTKLTEAQAPFGKAIATAEKVGLNGCAESLA